MEEDKVLEVIEKVRKESESRNFEQSFEFSIILRETDLDDPSNQIDDYIVLPKSRGKDVKVCAFVTKALKKDAEDCCEKVILDNDFSDWEEDSRKIRKLVRSYDFFVAQSDIMPDVAKAFGKYLGPKDKMPSPDAGSVITPNSDIEESVEKLRRTIRVKVKKQPVIHTVVGSESMSDEDIAENITSVYDEIIRDLPRAQQQVDRIYLKLSMGKPVDISS